MNTPPARSYSPRSTLVMAGFALVTAASLARPALAADAPAPVPNISIVDVVKGDDKIAAQAPTQPTTSNNSNNAKGGSNGKGGTPTANTRTMTTKGDVTYIIKLRNGSKFAAKGVQVEYHFYNRTTNTNNGVSTYSISPVESTESVDIDPGKVAEVQTQPISHANTQSQSGGASAGGGGGGKGGKGGKTVSSPVQSSSITSVLGWHIEVKFNDKVIKKLDYPDNLQDLLKKYGNN